MDSVYDNAILLALSSLIRISTDQRIFAPNRSFSQLVTSFFGAMYQGILRKPFVAWSSLFIYSSLQKNSILFTRLIVFAALRAFKIVLPLCLLTISFTFKYENFAFCTRLFLSFKEKTFYLAMQLLIFYWIWQQSNLVSRVCLPMLPFRVVGSNGLGPSTSRLSGVCSNQLSYEPISFFSTF